MYNHTLCHNQIHRLTFMRVQSSLYMVWSRSSVEFRYFALKSSPMSRRCLAKTILRRVYNTHQVTDKISAYKLMVWRYPAKIKFYVILVRTQQCYRVKLKLQLPTSTNTELTSDGPILVTILETNMSSIKLDTNMTKKGTLLAHYLTYIPVIFSSIVVMEECLCSVKHNWSAK